MMTGEERYKQQSAEIALDLVRPGMRLGLGTGSTANHMLRGLAARLGDGRLSDVIGVPTSEATAALARELGIPLTTLAACPRLDLALDGADEIGPRLALIKGLGAALLREKIVAASAERFVVIGSASKCVARLGERTPVPVEIVAFGQPLVERCLAALGARPELRLRADGQPVITDEGHIILDAHFAGIDSPADLAAELQAIPGVAAHGLFVGLAASALVVGPDGARELLG